MLLKLIFSQLERLNEIVKHLIMDICFLVRVYYIESFISELSFDTGIHFFLPQVSSHLGS